LEEEAFFILALARPDITITSIAREQKPLIFSYLGMAELLETDIIEPAR
jgi:hypothetical protein